MNLFEGAKHIYIHHNFHCCQYQCAPMNLCAPRCL